MAEPSKRRATSIRLPPKILKRLQAQAERRDVSVNFLASRAIERALPGWEEQVLE